MRGARLRGDRGSAAGELVVLAPVFFLFVAAIVYFGRLNVSSARVEAAARTAARTISLSRDPAGAVAGAEADAAEMTQDGSPLCGDMTFEATVTAEQVTVDIVCELDLSEFTLLQVPGKTTLEASAVEVIDRHRESGDG